MRVLILNQTFYPDCVATAQYASELSQRLAFNGHEVWALTAARGYDNPSLRFRNKEKWGNISIIRVPSLGLGKSSKARRAGEFAWFLFGSAFRFMSMGRFDVIVSLTSPPIISYLAAWMKILTKSRLVYWVMDLNPDEAVAAGWLREKSLLARGLAKAQSFSVARSNRVVVLDRFMEDRVRRTVPNASIAVIPPWQHDSVVFDQTKREEFRRQHNLENKFVVMYSGNHSPCHPLNVLLEAASQLRHENEIVFAFIGGGSEFTKVKNFARERQMQNIVTLPYQPKENLAGSLGAADLHVVIMGDPFVGIIHPCKVYNILALGAPFLYVGPELSHVTDIVDRFGSAANCVGSVRHGDVNAAVAAILKARREALYRTPVLNESAGQRLLEKMVLAVESDDNLPSKCLS